MRLPDRMRSKTLAFGTASMSLPLITMELNRVGLVLKLMQSSVFLLVKFEFVDRCVG